MQNNETFIKHICTNFCDWRHLYGLEERISAFIAASAIFIMCLVLNCRCKVIKNGVQPYYHYYGKQITFYLSASMLSFIRLSFHAKAP